MEKGGNWLIRCDGGGVDGEQWPPDPHSLKRLHILTYDGSRLVKQFDDPADVSDTDAATLHSFHVHSRDVDVLSSRFEACGHSPEDKRGPACFYVQKDADKLSPSKSFLLTSHCYRWSYDCLNSIWTHEGSPGRIEEAEKFIRFSYSCDQDVRINTDGGDWGFLKEATANGNSTRCN